MASKNGDLKKPECASKRQKIFQKTECCFKTWELDSKDAKLFQKTIYFQRREHVLKRRNPSIKPERFAKERESPLKITKRCGQMMKSHFKGLKVF